VGRGEWRGRKWWQYGRWEDIEDEDEAPTKIKAVNPTKAKKPQAKKPQAKKPQAKKPQAKKPQAKKPQAKKPQAKKPQALPLAKASTPDKEVKDTSDAQPHQRIDHTRILTSEDYEKLNRLKEMKAEGKITLARLKEFAKSGESSESGESSDEGGIVDPSSLTRGIKTPRKKGEERMAEIMEKRNSREKRTKIKTRLTTNQENTKRKNLMMIVKGKKQHDNQQKSWREKQMSQQKGKEKFKKRKHK